MKARSPEASAVLKSPLLWLVLAAAVVAILVTWRRLDGHSTFILPNGSSLTLLKTSYGRSFHRCTFGKTWEKVIFNRVPDSWLESFYATGVAQSGLHTTAARAAWPHTSVTIADTNALVFWFATMQTNRAGGASSLPQLRAAPLDDDGLEWPAVSTFFGASPGRPFSIALATFPRRGRFVTLRLYTRTAVTEWTAIGQLKVENPAFRPYPTWTTRATPTMIATNGFEFSVGLWNEGAGTTQTNASTRPIGNAAARFVVHHGGERTRRRTLRRVEVEDATGNLWRAYAAGEPETTLHFDGLLPTNETLSVRAIFSAADSGETNLTWRLASVPLPAPGKFLTFTQYITHAAGSAISLVGISAAGTRIPASGIYSSDELAHFRVSPDSDQINWRIGVVSVTDGNGKTWTRRESATRTYISQNLACPFTAPAGSPTADFVFALYPPIKLEFLTRVATRQTSNSQRLAPQSPPP